MASSVTATAAQEIADAPISEISRSPISSAKSRSSPQRVNRRVLTPVVVCGSPCVLPTAKEGMLSPLLTVAAAAAANNKVSTPGQVLQNNVPASESEKLTSTNIYVLQELERPRPRPADIESTVCPPAVEPFRKAWWAGVRPTTCERTCRHRSKICDAIQLCNDCTGYYCKWLAELVGIPVLKASGRVDPVIFERDKLAKLYWERISKVACCPKVTAKCLMCIRRYQLFTHFLPGNLDFRTLVHESVMKLHEDGFAVDMGLIRKVTRRLLECIADNMGLTLPSEYVSSYQAYDIIVRRGPLVDVVANRISSSIQNPVSSSSSGESSNSRYVLNASQRTTDSNYSPSSKHSVGDGSSNDFTYIDPLDEDGRTIERDIRRCLDGSDVNKRRSRRQVKRSTYVSPEDIYYGDDNGFLSMLDDNSGNAEDSEDSTEQSRRRKKKLRTNRTVRRNTGLSESPNLVGLVDQFPPLDGETSRSCPTLADQFRRSFDNEISIDTETIQMLSTTKKESDYWQPDDYKQSSHYLNNDKYDLSDTTPDAIDRLAAAVLQRFDKHRPKPQRTEQTVMTDGIHRRQLAEEDRLCEAGVRGVFWDPTKEGWCALLPLTPSYNDVGLATMNRKILCFSSNTWTTFESAKWSAVYERLRRNPRELEFLTQGVREDLSNWVKDHIEIKSENKEDLSVLESLSDLDLTQLYSAAASALANGTTGKTGKLSELLLSFANHISSLDEQAPPVADTDGTTTTGGASSDDQNATDEKQFSSATILGLLATLQTKLPAPDVQEHHKEIKEEVQT